jgi:hypothetical protein
MEQPHSPAKRPSNAEGHTYGPEELAAMAAQLRALPPADVSKRRTNKQRAIRYLADEIAALQGRGYTMEEVTDRLKGFGLDITTPTLRSYLQRAKDGGAKHSKARRRRPAKSEPVGDAPRMAAADNPGAASPEATVGIPNSAAPAASPQGISQSRSLHPENASTRPTTDTTSKAPTQVANRPSPPTGLRNDAPRADVALPRVSMSAPPYERRDTPSAAGKNGG